MSILDVTDISKSYGGIRALAGCTMAFEEGAINGLIGPNGSGKTTLFNVISGYERADAGQVTFRGTDVTSARPETVFEMGLGRTFQITRIFPRLTVMENLHVASQRQGILGQVRGWNSAAERERATEVLDFVGLTRLAYAAPAACPTGSRNCWSSPSSWSPSPWSSCSTSRPAALTRPCSAAWPIASVR